MLRSLRSAVWLLQEYLVAEDAIWAVVRAGAKGGEHPTQPIERLDWLPTKQQIGEEVAFLLGAYPIRQDGTFGGVLTAHLLALEPTIGALSIGCRTLARTSKFCPTVAEVVAAIDAAAKTLEEAWRIAGKARELLAAGQARLKEWEDE